MATVQSTYSISGSFNVGNITAGFQKIQSLASQTSQRVVSSINAQNKAFGGQHSQMARYGHAFTRFYGSEGMFRAGDIMRRNLESLKDYAQEAQKLAQAQFKFRVIGLDEGENQRAFGAAARTVSQLKGLRIDEVTETITDLHTAFGDLDHAMEHLGTASKFRFGFSTLLGDKFGPEQIEEQIQKGFKFLEVTGAVSKGAEEVDKRFSVMAQMMAATGGRVKASDMLLMAQRGGPAVRGLGVEGLRNLSAPLQELGASRTGTALMSLYQQLVGGIGGGQESTKTFLRLGLLDPKKVKMSKKGLPTHTQPGAFGALGEALQDDPLKAADMLIQAMAKPKTGAAIISPDMLKTLMAGKPLNDTDAKKVRGALANLFHNRMAQGLMDILITQRGQILKEAKLSSGAKSIQEVYDAALDTPMGKMKQFEAAIGNLKMEIGGPLLTAVSQAAKVLVPLINIIAKAPPWLTLAALGFGKIALAAFQMRMAFAMSGIGGIGGAASPAAASGGAAAFNALFTGTSGAAATTRWYQAALVRNIAAFGTLAIAVAAAAVIMNEYNKEIEAQEDEKKAQKGQAGALARLFAHGSYAQARDVSEKQMSLGEVLGRRTGEMKWGGPMSPLTWQRESMMEMLGRVPRGIYGGPGGAARTADDRREVVTALTTQLKEQMPQLKMASQIGILMEKIQSSNLRPEQREALSEAVKAAQPQAFKEWEEAMKAAGDNYKTATDALIKENVDAAHTLSSGLNRAAEAAESFADRSEKAWNAPQLQGAAYRGGGGHTFNVALRVVEGAPDNAAAAQQAADQFYKEVKRRLDDRHRQREVMA